jgi:hypothetical protein
LKDRPEVVSEPTAVTVAEQFQNQTLRPILKVLNDLIVAYYRHHLPKRKVPFARLTREDKLAHIERSVRDDTRLRMILIGMVLGQFTPEEWAVFESEEAELTRRISNLLIQRLQSQVEDLSVVG